MPKSSRRGTKRVHLGAGPACARCGKATWKWSHAPGWQPSTQKEYFAYWYECTTNGCRTRQIMPAEAKRYCVETLEAADEILPWLKE